MMRIVVVWDARVVVEVSGFVFECGQTTDEWYTAIYVAAKISSLFETLHYYCMHGVDESLVV